MQRRDFLGTLAALPLAGMVPMSDEAKASKPTLFVVEMEDLSSSSSVSSSGCSMTYWEGREVTLEEYREHCLKREERHREYYTRKRMRIVSMTGRRK